MNREIKFRVWDKKNNHFVIPWDGVGYDDVDLTYANNGKWYWLGGNEITDESAVIQQYTGFKDKNDIKIYEGDIVEFKYFAGDLAVSDMTEEEYEKYEKIAGQTFVGDVRQSLFIPCNLEIVSEINFCPAYFPLTYLHGATIIGNIFQPPCKFDGNGECLVCDCWPSGCRFVKKNKED